LTIRILEVETEHVARRIDLAGGQGLADDFHSVALLWLHDISIRI